MMNSEAERSSGVSQDPAVELSQTLFAEDVLFGSLEDAAPVSVPVAVPQNKRKVLLLLLVGLLASITLAASILLEVRRQSHQNSSFLPHTEQEQGVRNVSVLERHLSLLRQEIEQADPLQSPLAFPPIDFRLTLQDASAVQLERR